MQGSNSLLRWEQKPSLLTLLKLLKMDVSTKEQKQKNFKCLLRHTHTQRIQAISLFCWTVKLHWVISLITEQILHLWPQWSHGQQPAPCQHKWLQPKLCDEQQKEEEKGGNQRNMACNLQRYAAPWSVGRAAQLSRAPSIQWAISAQYQKPLIGVPL